MASFDMAEREGDRLRQNRSAESSPMTTLQKIPQQQDLFSSHSTPSSSYNKYAVNNGTKASPPSVLQKSVSSPTGTKQKSFCAPPNRNSMSPKQSPTDSSRALPPQQQQQQQQKQQHNVREKQHHVNLGARRSNDHLMAAQRKVRKTFKLIAVILDSYHCTVCDKSANCLL
jgi:hypothetical protein